MAKMIKITLKRSTITCTQKQKDNVLGLGLKKRLQTVYRQDTPEVRGMIKKVIHLLDIEKASKEDKAVERFEYVTVSAGKAKAKKAGAKTTKSAE